MFRRHHVIAAVVFAMFAVQPAWAGDIVADLGIREDAAAAAVEAGEG